VSLIKLKLDSNYTKSGYTRMDQGLELPKDENHARMGA